MTQVPVADNLFTWPADEPQLIGSRCTACGIVTFPAQASCPRFAPPAIASLTCVRTLSIAIRRPSPPSATGYWQYTVNGRKPGTAESASSM